MSAPTTSLTRRWLWLGVLAIALAGIYSLVPVLARTPQLKMLGIRQYIFDVALVVHVDLSVLIWFFAIFAMSASHWKSEILAASAWHRTLFKAGFLAVLAATLCMAVAPFYRSEGVIKSNYIPVLLNGMFFLSLGLLASGISCTCLALIGGTTVKPDADTPLREAAFLTAKLWLLSLVGYGLGARGLPPGLPLEDRFEILFWGGGHIMQFAFTLTAMQAWLWLLKVLEKPFPNRWIIRSAYGLTLLGAVASLAGYALYPADSGEFTQHQTRIMKEIGGLGASLMGAAILWQHMRHRSPRTSRVYRTVLSVALFLFFAGGVLGLLIAGQNVVIPAHYHGMIVGITLALMGVAYATLPHLGYGNIADRRLTRLQPWLYGIGQTMHIGGLAYCGGYGILRKTAGGFEGISTDIKIALGIFGLGGLLAIFGGLLFVVIMLRARRISPASSDSAKIA